MLDWKSRQCWADLGCGSGTFTRALASLLGPESHIYAIDRSDQSMRFDLRGVVIEFIQADFTQNIPVANLDGVLMANSFHYVTDQEAFLRKLITVLRPGGSMLFVEYDLDVANSWVPYPVSLQRMRQLIEPIGLLEKIGARKSAFGPQEMYASLVKLN